MHKKQLISIYDGFCAQMRNLLQDCCDKSGQHAELVDKDRVVISAAEAVAYHLGILVSLADRAGLNREIFCQIVSEAMVAGQKAFAERAVILTQNQQIESNSPNVSVKKSILN